MNKTNESSNQVSAIIALYNGANHITSAIESVLLQTTKVGELIIVDDGSTDNGVSVVENYILNNDIQDFQIKIIRQENSGQGSARNAGASKANNPFIGFLDQDDTWSTTHVEKLLKEICSDPSIGWVYTDFNEFDEQNRFIRRQFLAKQNYCPPVNSLFGFIDQDLMMLPSSALIRRDAFLAIGGFDTQFRGYEDDDLFIRLLVSGWDFKYFPEALVNYRIHPDNSSRNLSFPKSRIKFYRKYRNFFEKESDYFSKYLHQHLAPRMISAAIQDAAISARDKNEEARALASSFLKEIFLDTGFSTRSRIVYYSSRHPLILRLALYIRGIFRKPVLKKSKTY